MLGMWLLCLLLSSALAGQLPITPLFTPCQFPSPTLTPDEFTQLCATVPRMPFICDLHHQLAHTPLTNVEHAYNRYHQFFSVKNKSSLAIVLVRQLEQPPKVSTVYEDSRLSCLFDNDCNRIDAEVVSGFASNVKTFLKVYAWKVAERWFGEEREAGGCAQQPNVLALVVIDGLVNDARKIPYVRLHSGDNRLNFPLLNIQNEAVNAIVQGWPLQTMLEDLVSDIGYALKELHELNGQPRDHSVPRWARHVGALCVFLIVMAMVIEWYIVRRKLALRRSASGIKLSSVKSKTHLMF